MGEGVCREAARNDSWLRKCEEFCAGLGRGHGTPGRRASRMPRVCVRAGRQRGCLAPIIIIMICGKCIIMSENISFLALYATA